MDVPSKQPFYIFVSKFSDQLTRLPKHMIIAQTAPPPDVILTVEIDARKISLIETHEVDIIAQLNKQHIFQKNYV